jgi:hypothetical protein
MTMPQDKRDTVSDPLTLTCPPYSASPMNSIGAQDVMHALNGDTLGLGEPAQFIA